jgi:hypothetical protein
MDQQAGAYSERDQINYCPTRMIRLFINFVEISLIEATTLADHLYIALGYSVVELRGEALMGRPFRMLCARNGGIH